ncbi:MAG TPA: hypothetical protein GXX19_04940 [Syntrophomonadaceae bacterium]|nr:hypothetical protein [Syntrophomonadaceae bacterium]
MQSELVTGPLWMILGAILDEPVKPPGLFDPTLIVEEGLTIVKVMKEFA